MRGIGLGLQRVQAPPLYGRPQALALAFFNVSSSCAGRRARARSWRNSAAMAGSRAVPKAAATGV